VGAWINVVFLLIVLASRGHYRMPLGLLLRIAKQAIAAAAMGAALYYANGFLTGWFSAASSRSLANNSRPCTPKCICYWQWP